MCPGRWSAGEREGPRIELELKLNEVDELAEDFAVESSISMYRRSRYQLFLTIIIIIIIE